MKMMHWFGRWGSFLIASVILLASGLSVDAVLRRLETTFAKGSIEIELTLAEFDADALPSFLDDPGSNDVRIIPGDTETNEELIRPVKTRPGSDLAPGPGMLFVTYYSDPEDTVPHTPEVCYPQGGAALISMNSITIRGPDGEAIPANDLLIERGQYRMVVMYLFWTNGEAITSRERLRFALGWPGDRRVYFSKVETATKILVDETHEDARKRCQRLLEEALPSLVGRHYPSNDAVRVAADG